MTLIAVADVIQPEPSQCGAGDVCDGQRTVDGDEKSGTVDVTRRWTPDCNSEVEPPDQCRSTVEPGMTARELL